MKRRVLAIHWTDAASRDPWSTANELLTFLAEPCHCVTIGVEVRRDDQTVTVACSVNADEVGGVWKIPRKMIRRIQVLGKVEVPQ